MDKTGYAKDLNAPLGDSRGRYLPYRHTTENVQVTQIVGGRRWSLALYVKKNTMGPINRRTYLPHRHVTSDAQIIQVVGGRKWSLALYVKTS